METYFPLNAFSRGRKLKESLQNVKLNYQHFAQQSRMLYKFLTFLHTFSSLKANRERGRDHSQVKQRQTGKRESRLGLSISTQNQVHLLGLTAIDLTFVQGWREAMIFLRKKPPEETGLVAWEPHLTLGGTRSWTCHAAENLLRWD